MQKFTKYTKSKIKNPGELHLALTLEKKNGATASKWLNGWLVALTYFAYDSVFFAHDYPGTMVRHLDELVHCKR